MTYRDLGSRVVLTGLVLATLACAGQGAARREATTVPASGTVHLSVKNQHGFPVTVFAIGSGGNSVRLGKVLPGMVGEFELPNAMIGSGPVEFMASVDGDAPARSGRLLLLPGDVVDFVISRPTYSSTVTLRR